MLESQFTHVLFDAGGTLIGTNTDTEYWYEQFFVDACAEQGCVVSVHDAHEVLKRAARSRRFESRCSTDTQVREFWQHIYATSFGDLLGAKALRHPPAFIEHLAADYIDRYEAGEFVQLFPDALPTLERLKTAGFKIGIVSNFGSYLRTFLKQLEVEDFFDFVVISAEEGCEKPGADIFRRALARCDGAMAEQVIYVGDHPEEDYVPAQQHGMLPLLIDRHGRHAERNELRRISSLTEIPAIVKAA